MTSTPDSCAGRQIRSGPDEKVVTATLEDFQTDEQRCVLDVVSRIRKFGLNTLLDLPQIVVCGDQSSGKSSVLEALTRIRFPTSDNLCTRFATEINLRREDDESLSVRIVPHEGRDEGAKKELSAFNEKISDLNDLPAVIEKAKVAMGISSSGSAFSLDVLSIDIAGPERPQLSLVDIPGLIQSSTKGVSNKDVQTVSQITDRYITRSRTICLAVISATNDAANQGILQRVRKFDPKGSRTLGVVTKIDLLPDGSGSQAKFLQLSRNEDVFFDLGWHVIRNRKFEEKASSFDERDENERIFFASSPFGALGDHMIGVDSLRVRLSQLLFEHIKTELPKLLVDTERRLTSDEANLELLGTSRASREECRQYFAQLCMDCHNITKSALGGAYYHNYFKKEEDTRLRATIQKLNLAFSDGFHAIGLKYATQSGNANKSFVDFFSDELQQQPESNFSSGKKAPEKLTEAAALEWAEQMLQRSRGTELAGNFNPQLIAELFWVQSEKWRSFGLMQIELMNKVCVKFFAQLLEKKVPKDVRHRLRVAMIDPVLKSRRESAIEELDKIIGDRDDFPINYNHYYTDTIRKRREETLLETVQSSFPNTFGDWGGNYERQKVLQWVKTCTKGCSGTTEADMSKFSCKEALDCLAAIYKVQRKTFIANVTTQVVERQMLRGLADMFSPLIVSRMDDSTVKRIVSEQSSLTTQRSALKIRVAKLRECREELDSVLANSHPQGTAMPGTWRGG